MSKTKFSRHSTRDDDFEDEDRYQNGYHDHLAERRKLKRMKNALRSGHIEDLMDLEDDE